MPRFDDPVCVRDIVTTPPPDPTPTDFGAFLETADGTQYTDVGSGGNFSDHYRVWNAYNRTGPHGDHYRMEWNPSVDSYWSLSAKFYHAQQHGAEVEAAHHRFWLYWPEDWAFADTDYTLKGTKMCGHCGTYQVYRSHLSGGWGGRSSDGTNGWSTRMVNSYPGDSPYATGTHTSGQLGIASQNYHGGEGGVHGSVPHSSTHAWERGRWHQVDQYVQINTPGQSDGFHKIWLDGELALDYRDMMQRASGYGDTLFIQNFWHTWYFGGVWGAPKRQSAYMDDNQIWWWYDRDDADAEYPYGNDETVPTPDQPNPHDPV